jgi:hypothetical protein
VRRDVAALAFPRSGETCPTPRSARRPLRMWAEVSRMRRGAARVLVPSSLCGYLNGYKSRAGGIGALTPCSRFGMLLGQRV